MALPELLIQSVDNPAEYIRLSGRALPYRPMEWTGTQAMEIVWYPGNPQATAQALGPHEEVSTFRGFWKQRFISVIDRGLGSIVVNGQSIVTVGDAIDRLDLFRRLGTQVSVTWSTVGRIGFLTSLRQTWHTEQDCEWEMEWTWTARNALRIQTVVPQPPAGSLIGQLLANLTAPTLPFINDVTSALNSASSVTLAATQTTADLIAGTIGQITASTQALASVSASLNTGVSDIASSLGSVNGILDGLVQSYTTLASAIESVSTTAVISTGGAASASAQLASIIGWTDAATTFRQAARACAAQRAQIQSEITPSADVTYVASQGDDLRRVATLYLGSQNAWVDIALHNGLSSSLLSPGQTVRIPPVGTLRAA